MATKYEDYPCQVCATPCKRISSKLIACSDKCRLRAQTVKSNDCWLWRGGLRKGYGRIWFNGKRISAHRVSYQLFKGPIPPDLLILHSCHTPTCLNPDHLRLGTVQDNNRDTILSGRKKCGSAVANSKLTEEKVKEIRVLYESKKMAQQELANLYGVSQGMVGFIIRKVAWKHI